MGICLYVYIELFLFFSKETVFKGNSILRNPSFEDISFQMSFEFN